MKHKVIFLDRDGTLIHDRPGFYLKRPEQVRIYPPVYEALRRLKRAGYKLVVVSNQSGLGRGFFTRATLSRIHARLRAALRRRGADVDGIYFCPHVPDDGCRCRKPSPLLARRAVRELGLTLEGACVVGDKKADLDLARALGIPSVLVKTGHGREQRAKYGKALRPAHEAGTLLSAANWILKSALALALLAALPGAGRCQKLSSPYELIGATVPYSTAFSTVPFFPEALEFSIKWGVFEVGAATLKVERLVRFGGEPAYYISSEAKSNPFCDRFYPVRDLNESWLDAGKLHSLGYLKKLREGSFFRDEWVVYDYGKKLFRSKRVNKDGTSQESEGPIPGPVQDILSSLYFLRTKKLEKGDEVVLDVNTKSNWPLVIKVTDKQTIEVPAGRFKTVVVEPFVREEGIFVQKGKRLQIWMTADERHIPVFMRVEVNFGHVSAYLVKMTRR